MEQGAEELFERRAMAAHTLKAGLLGAAGLALAIGAAGTASAQDEEKVLNIYNWSDYIAEETIPRFEEQTGIDVRYDVYDSNEVLEAKILAGGTGYDLVVPSASFMQRQIKAGVYQKLDKSKLTNYDNLDETILDRVEALDPENAYGVPYMWGTTGFAYNTNMIAERMDGAPTGSWDMLFDPEVVKNFEDCGVTLLDAPSEVMDAAIKYLGHDPNAFDEENLRKAYDLLKKVRPYIKYFHSSQNINDLANGDICLAMGWSGDMFIARDRAAEADQGIEIAYTIPKEGAVIWFDMMAIPKDAPHPNNAHKFINYVLQPKIAAEISNYVWYANANAEATQHVIDEVKNDPGIYPPEEAKENLFVGQTGPKSYERLQTRLWTRLKTGQ